MDKNETPDDVWDSAVYYIGWSSEIFRMDKLWNYLNSINPDGVHRFHRLAKVAKLVLISPHSNASERVFSMVTKKTS